MSNTKTISRSAGKNVSYVAMKAGGLDGDEAALRVLDNRLSEALVDTFPASDPVSSLRFD